MKLPTQREICPVEENLDSKRAIEHFLNKDLLEAEQMFRSDRGFGRYWDDLMFMGPVAFRFYVKAAVKYLTSEAGVGDFGAAMSFAGCLDVRLEFEPNELIAVAHELIEGVTCLKSNINRFAHPICGEERMLIDQIDVVLDRLRVLQPGDK